MGKRKLLQILALLGLTHVACASVGLWWLYQTTRSTLRAELEQQVVLDLEAALRRAAGSFRELTWQDLKARLDAGDGQLPLQFSGEAGLVLLDANWRLIAPLEANRSPSAVRWIPVSPPGRETNDLQQGTLVLADGSHTALACPLGRGAGYLVAHSPQSVLTARLARLTGHLPSIALLTLVWTCVPVSIVVYMIARRCQEAADRERQNAQAEVMRQTSELVRTRDAIIIGLAKLAESRDPETGGHLERLSAYSTLLAAAMAQNPAFRDRITPTFVKLIGVSSVLHDIGKVGVPDSILLKRGRLTDSEREVMRHHAGIGGRCLREIERHIGSSNYLRMAREIALWHHERWDGSGYPDGLSGEDIPLAARIVALADVYDSLSTARSYKEAYPHGRCVAIIREQRGRQFDPDIVDVWLGVESQYRDVARRYAFADRPRAGESGSSDPVPQDELRDVAGSAV